MLFDADADGRADVNALATVGNLEFAITQWAARRVSEGGFLTIYIVDHGTNNTIFLDRSTNETLTSQQLDTWLSSLEAARPDIKVNVIIEASYAGSFIELPQSISKAGRLIIASAGSRELAYVSTEGAVFSDYLLAALGRNQSVYNAFVEARNAITVGQYPQTPLLDADGDSIPNESEDNQIAQQRGFGFVGTFAGPEDCEDCEWAPYIAEASGPTTVVQDGSATISATVRDNIGVQRVWAYVYPPSYEPPRGGENMVQVGLPEQPLARQSGTDQDGTYTLTLNNMTEGGTYRIVLYAEDASGQRGQPALVEIEAEALATSTPTPEPEPGQQVFLPLIVHYEPDGHHIPQRVVTAPRDNNVPER
jgi:hypothetical protein